jgi:hypothetical protein
MVDERLVVVGVQEADVGERAAGRRELFDSVVSGERDGSLACVLPPGGGAASRAAAVLPLEAANRLRRRCDRTFKRISNELTLARRGGGSRRSASL